MHFGTGAVHYFLSPFHRFPYLWIRIESQELMSPFRGLRELDAGSLARGDELLAACMCCPNERGRKKDKSKVLTECSRKYNSPLRPGLSKSSRACLPGQPCHEVNEPGDEEPPSAPRCLLVTSLASSAPYAQRVASRQLHPLPVPAPPPDFKDLEKRHRSENHRRDCPKNVDIRLWS